MQIHENVGRDTTNADSTRRADELIAWLREYAGSRINSQEIDERRGLPPYVVLDLGNRGALGLEVRPELGGLGLGSWDTCRVVQQVSAIDLSVGLLVSVHNALGLRPIVRHGSESLKAALVPTLASGRELVAFAMSEGLAGSFLRNVSAEGRRNASGGWALHGTKLWSGASAWAGVINTMVVTDEPAGTTVFAVRQGRPGLRIGRQTLTLGMRGVSQGSVHFEGVEVGPEDVLGQAGIGMEVARDTFMYGRLMVAAASLGAAKRALVLMERYAGQRWIDTGLLLDNPVARLELASLSAGVAALEALVRFVATRSDALGRTLEPAFHCCKIFGPELLGSIADRLVQMLGARGYVENNEAPRLFRDARALRIVEGPTETIRMFLGSTACREPQHFSHLLADELLADDLLERLTHAIRKLVPEGSAASQPESLSPRYAAYARIGTLATWALVLAAVRRQRRDSDSDDLRRAEIWCAANLEQEEQGLDRRSAAEQVLITSNEIQQSIGLYAASIGCVEQSLPGREHERDLTLCPKVSTDDDAEFDAGRDPLQVIGEVTFQRSGVGETSTADSTAEVLPELTLKTRNKLAALLGVPRSSIDVDASVRALGVSSLAVTELQDWLLTVFQLEVSLEEIIGAPSLRSLTVKLDVRRLQQGSVASDVQDAWEVVAL